MPTPVSLFRLPYDSAHHAQRMGAGPDRLAPAIAERLRRDGHDVVDETIEAPAGFRTEASAGFALDRALADRVRAACHAGRRPVVLSGNCLSSLGTVSGARGDVDDIGVIWFDAHGDLETPETTTSGFLDGMGLAVLMGRCWGAIASSIPGFRPVDGGRVVLVGARHLSDAEHALIQSAGVTLVPATALAADASALEPALEAIAARGVRRVYAHVDLDVHDPSAARINSYAVPNGLSVESVRDAVRRIGARFGIAAGAMTAYDPSVDPEGRGVAIATELAPLLV